MSPFRTKRKGSVFHGGRIREMRLALGWTLHHVADHIGISEQSVNRIELEQQEPSLRTARRMADMFNVTLDYLTEGP